MRALTVTALIAALAAGQALAQPRGRQQGKWEFSARAGWAGSSDESFVTSTLDGTKAVGSEVDGGAALAFGITDNFSRHVGAEFEYALSDHDATLTGLSAGLPALEITQRLHKFSYNAVIYPGDRRARLRPYGIAGAGATLFEISTQQDTLALTNNVDLRNRWEFMYNFGGGLKYLLGERWGLRFDFRNYVSNVPDYGLPREDLLNDMGEVVPGLRPEGQFHNWQLSAGFTYVIPGKR